MWTDAAADAQVIGWVRELWGALQPFSSGGLYVNYEAEHDVGRVQAAYSPAKYARLAKDCLVDKGTSQMPPDGSVQFQPIDII